MRISLDDGSIVLWTGPKEEVLDHGKLMIPTIMLRTIDDLLSASACGNNDATILVSTSVASWPLDIVLLVRFRLFGMKMSLSKNRYLGMANLSLCLFNLLPINGLDGSVLLEATLEYLWSGDTFPPDSDVLERGMLSLTSNRTHLSMKARISAITRRVTKILIGGCILLSALKWAIVH